MYNQVSLADLITRCRQRADMVNTQFVTDPEITGYLNESLGELYDLIIQNAGNEFFMRRCWVEETQSPTGGTTEPFNAQAFMVRDSQDGTFAVLPPNFYRLMGVEAFFGEDTIPWMLRPYTFTQRYKNSAWNGTWQKGLPLQYRLAGNIGISGDITPNPGQAGNRPVVLDPTGIGPGNTYEHQQRLYFTPDPPDLTDSPRMISVWYIPLPPKFNATDIVEPADQIIPSFAHWDEYLTVDVAARMRDKEESETQQLLMQKSQITARLLANVPDREAQFPEKVHDVVGGLQVRAYPYYYPNYWPNFWEGA